MNTFLQIYPLCPEVSARFLLHPTVLLAYTLFRQTTKINTSPVLQVVCYFPKNSRALWLSLHHIPRIRNEKNNVFLRNLQNQGTFAQLFVQIQKIRPIFTFPGVLWSPFQKKKINDNKNTLLYPRIL